MFFGSGPPRAFAARARNGRALVRAVASVDPFSIYSGSIVRSGDYISVERTATPGGYALTLGANGIAVAKAHSNTTQQRFHAEQYSRRLQMWTGDSTQYINNHAPVGILLALELVVGVEPTPLFLTSLFTDIDGDTVAVGALAGDIWPGGSRLGLAVSGAPTDVGSGSFQVLGSDDAGSLGTAQVNWTVLAAPPPPPAAGGLTEYVRVKTSIGGSLTGN
jgi:predicted RecA/RadA family phage recombinase